jgi:hypothetical protein
MAGIRRLMRLMRWWHERSRRTKIRLVVYPTLVLTLAASFAYAMAMPGRSYRGALPSLDDEQRRLAAALRRDVGLFARDIGERQMQKAGTLDRAWQKLDLELGGAGYDPKSLRYVVDDHMVANVEATREGGSRSSEIVVVGAHYDSAPGAPGADDNASGVAVLLSLARAFGARHEPRTIRFVAFVNEEPPHFGQSAMGSLHYAKACKDRGDKVVAMLSLESLGYFRDEPRSQKYPPIVSWFYPDRADFVAFVGNLSSRSLVREAIGTFRRAADFPSEGAAMPSFVTGVGWSDHWSFWQQGWDAVMITDTAPFRNPHYHTASDTPDTLDYDRLARVTAGLIAVVAELAQ